MADAPDQAIRSVADIDGGLAEPRLPVGVADFYDRLFERMKDFSEGGRRAVLSLLLATAAIELLDRAAIANVQVGPFAISDLSLVRKLLPVLTAYLIYDLILTGFGYMACRRIATLINSKYRPGLVTTRLARLSYPQPAALLWPLPWHRRDAMSLRLVIVFGTTLRMAGMSCAFLLEATWFWRLFRNFGLYDITTWISALLSACFLSFALLLTWEAFRTGHFTLVE